MQGWGGEGEGWLHWKHRFLLCLKQKWVFLRAAAVQVTMLLDRLNQSTDELEQMKTAFERQASLHDNEIRGLNDRLQRVTHQFDSAAATMRQASFLRVASFRRVFR